MYNDMLYMLYIYVLFCFVLFAIDNCLRYAANLIAASKLFFTS